MTIKEIARLANVSTGTVDRVIHNRGYVRAEKKVTIEKIIKDTDYKPNLCARNLKLHSKTVVGFVTPLLSSENGYWNLVFQGVQKAQKDLADYSYEVRTRQYDRNIHGAFAEVCDELIDEGVRSFIIIPKCIQEAKELMLQHNDFNFIWMDSIVPDVHPLCRVGEDPYKGGRLSGCILSMFVKASGSILTVSFNDSYISKERIRGFRDYYQETRNKSKIIEANLKTPLEIPGLLDRLETAGEHIDGVFSPCSAGHYFGELLNKRNGMDDVAIITYDFTLDNKKSLASGEISCILSQRPFSQGSEGGYISCTDI